MPLKGDHKREYQRQWRAKRKGQVFANQHCLWCGSTTDLELHHQDPSQKIDSEIWTWSEQRRKEEIAKCIILCKICHRGYHAELLRNEARGKDYSNAPLIKFEFVRGENIGR